MSSDLLQKFDCNVLCNRYGTTLLGAAFGSPSHISLAFSKFVSKTESILLSLKEIDDPQIAFQLQRYCASTCLVSHLLCCTTPGVLQTSVSTLDSITRRGFADIHDIPLALLQPQKFSWTQATLPIRHGGLGLIPASRIAGAAYVGSVTDTSELSGVLPDSIQDKHSYLPEKIIQDAISRIQDTHSLEDTYSCTGLLTRRSLGFRQTQRFLSLAIHNAASDGFFSP